LRLLWLVPAIVGLGSLLYLPTVRYGFVWDDTTLILQNRDLDVANPLVLFGRSFAVLQPSGDWQRNQYYRPLVTLSLWADKQVWGTSPAGFHLTNVLLNAAVTLLVGLLLVRMLPSFWPAFLGSLAFLLHPAHVEAVAFVSGRTDVLMAFFVVSALLGLVRYRSGASAWWSALVVAAYAAALLCKETALLLPLVAWLYLAASPRCSRSRILSLLLALAGVALLYLAARLVVLAGYVPHWAGVDLGQRVLLVVNSIGRYAFLSVVPFFHRLVYTGPEQFARPGWPTLVGLGASAGMAVLAIRQRRAVAGFGALCFLAFILPVCDWFPPGVSYLAERLLYLPVLGVVLVVLDGSRRLRTKGLRRTAVVLAGLYCIAMGWDTLRRMPVWQSQRKLFETMVAEAPDSPSAHDNLGALRRDSGDIEGAIREHRRAVELDPSHATAHSNLGNALLEAGRLDEARAEYERSVELAPDFALGHNNLGVVLQLLRDSAKAESEFHRAKELQRSLALARNNLGEIYLSRGQLDSAAAEFRAAQASQPDYALAYLNLGFVMERRDMVDSAAAEYEAALRLQPGLTPAREGLVRLGRRQR